MITIKNQQGVGMVEVLVALVLLAIGVLGFTALQLRAVDATIEANNRIQAMNLARDLSERIRANNSMLATYIAQINSAIISSPANCYTTNCTSQELATFDAAQVGQKAQEVSLSIRMPVCQGVSNGRRCIYVAWGNTTPTNGTTNTDCTNGPTYVVNSQCLVVETF